MNQDDRLVREFDIRVVLGQSWIVPGRDFAKKNPSQRFWSELQFRGHPGDVVRRDISTEYGGDMQNLGLGFLELLVGHRAVAGAEVHRAGQHLANATAAADRLIVDFNVRMKLVVLTKPLRVHRIGEGRTSSV
jgi:hypothetical protein